MFLFKIVFIDYAFGIKRGETSVAKLRRSRSRKNNSSSYLLLFFSLFSGSLQAFKRLNGYTKNKGSSAAIKFGVKLHLFFLKCRSHLLNGFHVDDR